MDTNLAFFSIEQTLNTYKYLFEKEPLFGMNLFAKNFKIKEVVLLDDTKTQSQGIPLRFAYYAFFLRIEGETTRSINQYDYLIKPQSLHLVHPGTIYSFKDITKNSRTYVLLFEKNFLLEDNLMPTAQESLLKFHEQYPQEILLESKTYSLVLEIFEQLSNELKSSQQDYKITVRMLINQLLYILKREKLTLEVKKHITSEEQLSSDFLALVQKKFSKVKSVQGYADILGVTPRNLTQTVFRTHKKTALSFIHIRIIREIQYLLCFSTMSIKQISHALNFEKPTQFSRFFKHHEKISPREYRIKNTMMSA